MSRLSNEQLFHRFRRHTDAAALGEVFDRTAEDLFKLALYLGPDAHQAEDLVQATYLTAMEHAASFDARRELLPWLLGILGNHARKARDRARRRVQHRRLSVPSGVDDPEQLAEHSELQATLDSVVSKLPQPYRQVLTLHLRHGLNARQISVVLERPAGTVRSQVVRGLELLRRLLPAGLLGVAMVAAPGHVLAGVKAELLRSAERMAVDAASAVAAGASGAGPWAGWNPFLGLCALVLFGVLGLWFGGDTLASVASSSTLLPAELVRVDTTVAAGAADPSDTEAAEQRSAVATPRFDVTVQVTADGAAVPAGLLIELLPDMGEAVELLHLIQLRPTRRLCRTDASGRVRFRQVPAGGARCLLAGSLRHGVDFRVGAGAVNRAALALPGWRRIHGRVVDADGRPRSGAEVWASTSGNEHSVGVVVARTDRVGRFACVAIPGPLQLWSTAAELGPSRLEAVPGGETAEVELRLTRDAGQLDCTVSDAAGVAIAGVVVQLLPCSVGPRQFAPVYATTDARGALQLRGLACGPAVLVARKTGQASATASIRVRPRGGAVALQLPRSAAISGTTRRSDGEPWPGLVLLAEVADSVAGARDAKLRCGMVTSDAAGRFRFDDLPPGLVRIRVVDLPHTNWVDEGRFDLQPGQRLHWDPRDAQAPYLRGRVVDSQGKPVVGLPVKATPSGETGRLAKYRTKESCTDAAGEFDLRPLERGTRYHLAVFSAEGSPSVLQALSIVTDQIPTPQLQLIELVSSVGRTLVRGSLVDSEGVAVVRGTVLLRRLPFDVWDRAELRDGRFELRLPAGRYQFAYRVEGYGVWVAEPFEIAGEHLVKQVCLPASGRLSATIRGLRRGVAEQPLQVSVRDCHGRLVAQWQGDGEGPLHCRRALPPGNYVLQVAQDGAMPIRRPIRIAAGDLLEFEQQLQSGRPCALGFVYDPLDNNFDGPGELQVSIRDADANLVVDRYLAAQRLHRFDLTVDLAPGRYRVEATSAWGGRAATVLVVAAVPRRLEQRLRVRR